LEPCGLQIKESSLINFWKLLQLTGMRGPFESEGIALQLRGIPLSCCGPNLDDLARFLFYRGQREKVAGRLETKFFLEFALRRLKRIFTGLNLALGDCPRTQVLVFPKRSTRVHKKKFRVFFPPSIQQ